MYMSQFYSTVDFIMFPLFLRDYLWRKIVSFVVKMSQHLIDNYLIKRPYALIYSAETAQIKTDGRLVTTAFPTSRRLAGTDVFFFFSFFVVYTFYAFSSRAVPLPPPTCSVLTKTNARRPGEHVVILSTDTHAVFKISCSVCFLPPCAYDTSSVITPGWWRRRQCVQSDWAREGEYHWRKKRLELQWYDYL